jgi:hypothetical protein
LDFVSAAELLETDSTAKREKLCEDFYDLLDKNKEAFVFATTDDLPESKLKGGRDTATQLLKILRAIRDYRQFTEEQEEYIRKVAIQLEEGGLPKQTAKTALQEINTAVREGLNPLKMLGILQKNIPAKFLQSHLAETSAKVGGPREVILSEYLIGD